MGKFLSIGLEPVSSICRFVYLCDFILVKGKDKRRKDKRRKNKKNGK